LITVLLHLFQKGFLLNLYAAILDVFAVKLVIDNLLIVEDIARKGQSEEVGGLAYLYELTEKVATSVNWRHHADIIYEKYLRRRLIETGNVIIETGYDTEEVGEGISQAESLVFNLGKGRMSSDFLSMKKVAARVFDTIHKRLALGGACIGTETGFPDLDQITSGLKPSELIILAARPAMGKSALALNLALNIAEKNKTVAFFSLEMSIEQLGMRFLAMKSGIDSQRLQRGILSEQQIPQLAFAAGALSKLPIMIEDVSNCTVPQMVGKCRRLAAERDVGLVILDYLQLLGGVNSRRGENRQQEISDISRGLKILARELDIPVLALSQLSRGPENRPDKRPMLSDLRESGAIEQDADMVFLMYREDYYKKDSTRPEMKGITEVIVAKNRQGPVGTVPLYFDSSLTRFRTIPNRDQLSFD
jgi:replicative DNA helicase